MSAAYWALWAVLGVVNAGLLIAAWRQAVHAQALLEEALDRVKEAQDIAAAASALLDEATP